MNLSPDSDIPSRPSNSRKRRLDPESSTNETEQKVRGKRARVADRPAPPLSQPRSTALMPHEQKLKAYDAREDHLRSLASCKICFGVLYEPYTIGCGHTYCYSCLCQWFDNNGRKKKTCPDCRTAITKPPAPAYVLREMIRELLRRPELLPPGESVPDHTKNELTEAATVEADRANKDPVKGGLFRGLFKQSTPGLGLLHDAEDGILRCPRCAWEWEDEGGVCGHCNFAMSDWSEDEDYSGDESLSGEDETDDDDLDGDLDMDDAEFDESIATTLNGYETGYENAWDNPIMIRDGSPPPGMPMHYELSSSPSYHTAGSDASGEHDTGVSWEESSDEDSSLDGFVARDEETIHEDAFTSDEESVRTATPVPASSSQLSRRQRRVIEDDSSEEDDDSEAGHPPVVECSAMSETDHTSEADHTSEVEHTSDTDGTTEEDDSSSEQEEEAVLRPASVVPRSGRIVHPPSSSESGSSSDESDDVRIISAIDQRNNRSRLVAPRMTARA